MTTALTESDIRAMRDEARRWVFSADHSGADAWREMAELGWLGLMVPERFGGSGAGAAAAAAVMEAVGAGLVDAPVAMVGAVIPGLLEEVATEEQKSALLPRLAKGEMTATFAHFEPGSGYDRGILAAQVERREQGLRLTGRKSAVVAAEAADMLLVSARAPDGELALWQVDPAAQGVTMSGFRSVDRRRMADLLFEDVMLPESARLGAGGDCRPQIEEALDTAALMGAAEALGAMDELLSDTAAYLQVREQFGRKLSEFQALQHRLVDAFVAREESRAALEIALRLRGTGPEQADQSVSVARAIVCRAANRIGREAIQLHGGIGMTEDLRVGRLFKRILVACSQYGDADWFAARFAGAMEPAETSRMPRV